MTTIINWRNVRVDPNKNREFIEYLQQPVVAIPVPYDGLRGEIYAREKAELAARIDQKFAAENPGWDDYKRRRGLRNDGH